MCDTQYVRNVGRLMISPGEADEIVELYYMLLRLRNWMRLSGVSSVFLLFSDGNSRQSQALKYLRWLKSEERIYEVMRQIWAR